MSDLPSWREYALTTVLPVVAIGIVIGCGAAGARSSDTGRAAQTLTLGAYTTPREAYGNDILAAFANEWRAATGRSVGFEESYLASGAQARAIAGGFEADVAALSLEPDIEQLVTRGLVTHDWRARARGGMVSHSLVVIGVRPGNPKGIRRWEDLARPGIAVLTPSPKTSGGAMWNAAALFGAAWLGHVAGTPKGDSVAAEAFMRRVLANVTIMDKGARESMLTFEHGVGDAVITYENEVLAAREAGERLDYIVPHATLLIENPVAVVDVYVDKHGTRDLSDAFVQFLITPDAQRKFASRGFRPVDPDVAREYGDRFPAADPFTIADLGGWTQVVQQLFAPGALFDRASLSSRAAP